MILVDTHCHLDFPDFKDDRARAIEAAGDAGVKYLINVGSSLKGSKASVALAAEYPGIYATVGIHPHYAKDTGGKIPEEALALARSEKVVAIGEIGLDYYRNLSPKEDQKELFRRFIDLAKERALPIVVHSRDAQDDTLAILRDKYPKKARGVMHCFAGDKKALEAYLGMGFYISFTCNLTYKKADKLRDVAGKVPLDRLLIETDAPYLPPQEFRGKRNEPAYVTALVKELAGLTGHSEEDIARITTRNAQSLFGLPIEERPMIAYPIRDSLYLNITNRCTNACAFCVRNYKDIVKGHYLKLEKEPEAGEIIAAIGDPAGYKEIVFCGYGEPTLRLDCVKAVSKKMKAAGRRVRMVTNGAGNLINKRSIVSELVGLVDRVSVSMNVDTAERYMEMCKPDFGQGTFAKIKEFAAECKASGIEVELTFLDIPGVDEKECERMAREELGVGFRLRHLDVVG